MIVQAIGEGLLAGLILSVFLGPIFFTMLQLGVEHGFKAAFFFALGQWVSDFIFIFLAFSSSAVIQQIIDNPATQGKFILVSGTLGGCLLILFGVVLLFTKSVSTEGATKAEKMFEKVEQKTGSGKSWMAYTAYFSQGFLINTINPTPLFFWMGLMGAAVSREFSDLATYSTYLSVMLVVVVTDLLKIYLAKKIRKRLSVQHILWVRRLAGLGLAVWGLFMLIRVNL